MVLCNLSPACGAERDDHIQYFTEATIKSTKVEIEKEVYTTLLRREWRGWSTCNLQR